LLTNQSAITINGTVGSSSNKLKINGISITNTNGSFSSSVNLASQGYNNIRITAYNNSGDSTVVIRTVKYDSIAPVVTITTPSNELITNSASLAITGTVTDANGISSFKINQDSTITIENGSFSHTIALSHGSNTIAVTAKDGAGNTTTVTRTVSLDTDSPVITINLPAGITYTNQTQYIVTGSVSESISVLTINGDTTSVSQNNFTKTINLTEGQNSVALHTVDLAGNSTDLLRFIKLDTSTPTLNVSAPADNYKTNLNQVLITGSVTEAGLFVKVNSDSVIVDQSLNFSKAVSLAEGLNSLSVTAKDSANNITTVLRTIRRDSNPPVLAISAPVDNLITKDMLLTVSGTVTDSTLITLTVNQDTVQVAAGNFSKQLSLTEGLNNIIVKAVDEPGNEVFLTRSLRLDTKKPDLSIQHVINYIKQDTTSVTINGTFNDSTAVTITVNNAPPTVIAARSFISNVYLVNNNNTIIVKAVDSVGNDSTITFTVNTTPIIIPPDPVTIATKIDSTSISTVFSANKFLFTGPDPIQKNVTPDAITEIRGAMISGQVFGRDNSPIPGVKVAILNHPEFGFTHTRVDGKFNMVLNGGGQLVIDFSRSGLLSAQRNITVQWQGYAQADNVVMVPLDPIVTAVNFQDTLQVVKGSASTDNDGTRRPVLMFEKDTQATMVLPDGSTQNLTSINVRATEYTVGPNGIKAMPAPLPPQTAYTYCVEVSADEAIQSRAKSVQFDKPIPFFVENFLGFPVGENVPSGYYDKDKGVWVPSESGKVIKILSKTNGVADIDSDGDNASDDSTKLASLGITLVERIKLANEYNAGQSLWRVPLMHFTSYDFNPCFRLPEDAKRPNEPKPKNNLNNNKEDCKKGSIIGIQTQTLGESVNIAGTPFSLNYTTARQPGYKAPRTITIPLTTKAASPSLEEISLTINIAGKQHEYLFPAGSASEYTFTWDGLDEFGRIAKGSHPYSVSIQYRFPAVYARANRFGSSNDADVIIGLEGNRVFTWLTQNYEGLLENPTVASVNNWDLSVHHFYDPKGLTLYEGTGFKRQTQENISKVSVFAGTGNQGNAGLNGLASNIDLNNPQDVATAPSGNIYIADYSNNRILKVDNTGLVTKIAGATLSGGYNGDNIPAVNSDIKHPSRLKIDRDENIYFIDEGNGRIRKISNAGIITTVAGNGIKTGYPVDNAAAVSSTIGFTDGLAVGNDGSIYLSSRFASAGLDTIYYDLIRRVDPSGKISTIAGVKETYPDFEEIPDSARALNVHIHTGLLDVTDDGTIYFASDRIIKKIDPTGIMKRIAGTHQEEYRNEEESGNKGLAIEASLGTISGITHDKEGNIYFSEGSAYSAYYAELHPSFSTSRSTDKKTRSITNEIEVKKTPSVQTKTANNKKSSKIVKNISKNISSSSALMIGRSNNVIRKISSDGYVSKYAGILSYQEDPYEGTENMSTSTQFDKPAGISMGADGYLYIADNGTFRIRRVEPILPVFSNKGYNIVSEDGKEVYIFDKYGKHLETIDPLTGNKLFRFSYSQKGLLTSIKDVDSLSTTIERDTAGVARAIVSPFGQRTEFTIGAHDRITEIINPANEIVKYEYGQFGLATKYTDARNNSSTFEYDALGLLTKDTDPLGGYTTLSKTVYDDGYLVTATTAGGIVTRHRINNIIGGGTIFTNTGGDGLVTVTTETPDLKTITINPDGMTTKTQYKPDPRFGMAAPLIKNLTVEAPSGLAYVMEQVKNITQMTGNTVTGLEDRLIVNFSEYRNNFNWDLKQLESYSPMGIKTTTLFNNPGRVTQVTVPLLNSINYSYNSNGFLTQVTQGTRSTIFDYDTRGRVKSIKDPMNRTEYYSYDSLGRVNKQTLNDGREMLYSYDANGNLTSITPPGRAVHSFDYNAVNNPVLYNPPLTLDTAGILRYRYNLDKQLTKIIKPDGREIDLNYFPGNCGCSSANKPSSIGFNRGSLVYSYYPTTGLLSSIIAPTNDTLKYYYDGSLLNKIQWRGIVNGEIGLEYDNYFRLASQNINGNNYVYYSYDTDGLVNQIGNLNIQRSPDNGMVTGTTLGNIASAITYNGYGEAANYSAYFSGTEFFSTSYAHDSLGRITTLTETINGTANTYKYLYTQYGYLAEVRKNDTTRAAYNYDANGARINAFIAGVLDTAHYDAQDRMISYNNYNYTYTKNGDLSLKIAGTDTTAYNYDDLGNLIQVKLPNGNLIEYVVDAQNRRIAKKVNNIVVRRWIYDNALTPAAELDASGNVIARYIGSYMFKDGTNYQIITDHLGSVRLVVNASTGAIKQRIDYDEYGRVLLNTNPDFQPLGYAGGIYDNDTKLVRFGARDYDAYTGRWTAKDPIGFRGGQANLYIYVNNNPIVYLDPDGLGRFGYRSLKGPFGIKVPMIWSKVDEKLNTVIAHEHYWFDNKTNAGYGKNGMFNEDITAYEDYVFFGDEFDDDIMRIAINNNQWKGKDYSILGNQLSKGMNCQDWADAVRKEYYRIKEQIENDSAKNKCKKK
jgi:RHS repeat-associated protein